MAPNVLSSPVISETVVPEEVPSIKERSPLKIVWINVALFVYMHVSALYGLYLMFTTASWITNVFALALGYIAGFSITAGCHRLWCHRSYKAKTPLRIFLALLNLVAVQNDIHEWVRDHRVHHKFSDTDADPHNSQRGFFFAHMGWLMCKKHPDVIAKGKTMDMSDVLADPVVRVQMRFYKPLVILFSFYLPTVIPNWYWGESYWVAYHVAGMFRYAVSLHGTWLVNSAAHFIGDRPYDKNINARENLLVVFLALGEGFHNYHHSFPWDYATSEFGRLFNPTTYFIEFMAKIGQAYDLKTASPDLLKKRMESAGDGTVASYKPHKA